MAQTSAELGLPPTLGWDVVDWIEAECVHGDGDVAGDPVVFDDERVGVVVQMYELAPAKRCPACRSLHDVPLWDYPWTCPRPKCGAPLPVRRRWKTVKLSRPKGWSKSGLASKLVCAEALAEVRFDGWGADGEPRARPMKSPQVRIAALSEDQAGETTFTPVAAICDHLAQNGWPVDIGRGVTSSSEIKIPAAPGGGHGFIKLATMKSASSDGGKTTFAVTDEEHLYTLPEHHRLHATIRRNLRKRPDADPWGLGTTTMYRPGEGSVAEAADAADVDRREQAMSLVLHAQADDDLDVWTDRDQQLVDRDRLEVGLQQAYGDAFPWAVDVDGMVAEFGDLRNDPADSERYFLNRRTEHDDAFVFAPQWAQCTDEDVDPSWLPDDGEHCVFGFDGARSDDHTGFVGVHVPTARLFVAHHWNMQDLRLEDDWELQVEPAGKALLTRWGTTRLYPDPPFWNTEVARWEHAAKQGQKVRPFQTGKKQFMSPALKAFREAVKAGAARHTGHPALTLHATNARLVRKQGRVDKDLNPDGEWWAVRKPTQTQHDPTNKIDLLVCAVLAWSAYLDAVAGGDEPVKKKSPASVFSW